jgi:hypothetical protein
MSFLEKAGIFITGFLLLAVIAKEIIALIADFILAPLFGMRVKAVSFFGLAFNLQNGKWVASQHKKTALIQHEVRFDDRIPVEEYSDKKSKWLQLTTTVIKILAAAAICFACRGFFSKDKKSPLDILIISFALGMVLQALTSLGIFLYTHLILMKRLGGYINTLLSRLRKGEELSSLNMQPVEMLPYENPTKTEKILYYQIYMAHLAATDNYEAMRSPSHQAMDYIMSHDYLTQETLAYYWLIFYFSEVEPDEKSAKALLEKLGDIIRNDKDPNARRVLAYYMFNIQHNAERAEALVTEGFAALNTARCLSTERELERKLLTKLNSRIIEHKHSLNAQTDVH